MVSNNIENRLEASVLLASSERQVRICRRSQAKLALGAAIGWCLVVAEACVIAWLAGR